MPLQHNKTQSTGINLIGDTTGELGLAETTRITLSAMIDNDIPVSYIEHNYTFAKREKGNQSRRFDRYKNGHQYAINLLFYNIYDMQFLDDNTLRNLTADRYTIGYWIWEQSKIAPELHEHFYKVDEIWTATRFCQQAFAGVRPIPVKVIPYPIQVQTTRKFTKHELGVDGDRPVFLFSFSVQSLEARKNSLGLIEAFRRAFPKDTPNSPVLLLKALHLDTAPDLAPVLEDRLSQVNGILMDDSLTRQEMNNLLGSVDCYISLHRSEGFGLGMAESMALGVPVIATHFSGNTDFMTRDNSFPVRYDLIPVTDDLFQYEPDRAYMYQRGQLWADPDLDHAAELMQTVISNPALAQERARLGQKTIQDHFSPQAVADLIRKRITAINPDDRRAVYPAVPVSPKPYNLDTALDIPQAFDMNAMTADLRQRFQTWDYDRVPETRNRWLRLPVIGVFLRVFMRVWMLGKLWADLKYVLMALIALQTETTKKLQTIDEHDQTLNQLRADNLLHTQRERDNDITSD